uniref:Uncharacterized protein n=1 Tax=Chromera velia CCMP2878 TaxID=1169474 RepID=A0A0G4FSJ9_9ALVE|eukprot:Cvel_18543.t1-p1 / transcript=Cvel_18543.t1 / gene=Cvel_18543 / organism=Chromera_velia_CCMP2878 / gene_product=hypothetical protein / transcript_product=hypothetical protein / location=Cvel_scaffold1543:33179-41662(-) / protein_length=1811 / sequence_SO=supercontig / SO=protein_coding / is_pseudo=false
MDVILELHCLTTQPGSLQSNLVYRLAAGGRAPSLSSSASLLEKPLGQIALNETFLITVPTLQHAPKFQRDRETSGEGQAEKGGTSAFVFDPLAGVCLRLYSFGSVCDLLGDSQSQHKEREGDCEGDTGGRQGGGRRRLEAEAWLSCGAIVRALGQQQGGGAGGSGVSEVCAMYSQETFIGRLHLTVKGPPSPAERTSIHKTSPLPNRLPHQLQQPLATPAAQLTTPTPEHKPKLLRPSSSSSPLVPIAAKEALTRPRSPPKSPGCTVAQSPPASPLNACPQELLSLTNGHLCSLSYPSHWKQQQKQNIPSQRANSNPPSQAFSPPPRPLPPPVSKEEIRLLFPNPDLQTLTSHPHASRSTEERDDHRFAWGEVGGDLGLRAPHDGECSHLSPEQNSTIQLCPWPPSWLCALPLCPPERPESPSGGHGKRLSDPPPSSPLFNENQLRLCTSQSGEDTRKAAVSGLPPSSSPLQKRGTGGRGRSLSPSRAATAYALSRSSLETKVCRAAERAAETGVACSFPLGASVISPSVPSCSLMQGHSHCVLAAPGQKESSDTLTQQRHHGREDEMKKRTEDPARGGERGEGAAMLLKQSEPREAKGVSGESASMMSAATLEEARLSSPPRPSRNTQVGGPTPLPATPSLYEDFPTSQLPHLSRVQTSRPLLALPSSSDKINTELMRRQNQFREGESLSPSFHPPFSSPPANFIGGYREYLHKMASGEATQSMSTCVGPSTFSKHMRDQVEIARNDAIQGPRSSSSVDCEGFKRVHAERGGTRLKATPTVRSRAPSAAVPSYAHRLSESSSLPQSGSILEAPPHRLYAILCWDGQDKQSFIQKPSQQPTQSGTVKASQCHPVPVSAKPASFKAMLAERIDKLLSNKTDDDEEHSQKEGRETQEEEAGAVQSAEPNSQLESSEEKRQSRVSKRAQAQQEEADVPSCKIDKTTNVNEHPEKHHGSIPNPILRERGDTNVPLPVSLPFQTPLQLSKQQDQDGEDEKEKQRKRNADSLTPPQLRSTRNLRDGSPCVSPPRLLPSQQNPDIPPPDHNRQSLTIKNRDQHFQHAHAHARQNADDAIPLPSFTNDSGVCSLSLSSHFVSRGRGDLPAAPDSAPSSTQKRTPIVGPQDRLPAPRTPPRGTIAQAPCPPGSPSRHVNNTQLTTVHSSQRPPHRIIPSTPHNGPTIPVSAGSSPLSMKTQQRSLSPNRPPSSSPPTLPPSPPAPALSSSLNPPPSIGEAPFSQRNGACFPSATVSAVFLPAKKEDGRNSPLGLQTTSHRGGKAACTLMTKQQEEQPGREQLSKDAKTSVSRRPSPPLVSAPSSFCTQSLTHPITQGAGGTLREAGETGRRMPAFPSSRSVLEEHHPSQMRAREGAGIEQDKDVMTVVTEFLQGMASSPVESTDTKILDSRHLLASQGTSPWPATANPSQRQRDASLHKESVVKKQKHHEGQADAFTLSTRPLPSGGSEAVPSFSSAAQKAQLRRKREEAAVGRLPSHVRGGQWEGEAMGTARAPLPPQSLPSSSGSNPVVVAPTHGAASRCALPEDPSSFSHNPDTLRLLAAHPSRQALQMSSSRNGRNGNGVQNEETLFLSQNHHMGVEEVEGKELNAGKGISSSHHSPLSVRSSSPHQTKETAGQSSKSTQRSLAVYAAKQRLQARVASTEGGRGGEGKSDPFIAAETSQPLLPSLTHKSLRLSSQAEHKKIQKDAPHLYTEVDGGHVQTMERRISQQQSSRHSKTEEEKVGGLDQPPALLAQNFAQKTEIAVTNKKAPLHASNKGGATTTKEQPDECSVDKGDTTPATHVPTEGGGDMTTTTVAGM